MPQKASSDIYPIPGAYKQQQERFTYDDENDIYHCRAGKHLKFIDYKEHHYISRTYRSKRSDCKDCPLRTDCLRKAAYKTLTDTLDRPLFDQMHNRINSGLGKQIMTLRKSTVEPIIGTLVEYLGMQKVYTKGIHAANKCMLMAGIAYNLKKMIKYANNGFWLPLRELIAYSITIPSFNSRSALKAYLNLHLYLFQVFSALCNSHCKFVGV